MATTPVAHSSSPAVVKVTSTAATVATASFDPPARSAIVVGFTSDADNNGSATAPTISGGTGITWTRVGPSLGWASTGDVGVVALWQGVFTDPNADPASMTVTVTHNIGATSKPRMLVCRVYDDTAVDITDPIGAVVGGSFAASSTTVQAPVTPETSGGGLRGLWLDWAATGTPTAFLPNNTTTELVDAYHNAGLSTNVQIGKSTTTTAGVAETIGATLLSASSDGNYVFYELRAAPVTGPSFDSASFDPGAFYTTDAAIPTGSGTGSLAFVGSASGQRAPKASGTGTLAFSGSAAGKRSPKASGVGSLTLAGSAVGAAPTPPPSTGSGAGSLGFAGTASGKRVAKASSSGTVTITGSATGQVVRRGTGTGSLAFAGTAAGKRTPKATGNATLAFVGTATGKRAPKANGTGGLTLTGTAVGNSPTPGLREGVGTGALGWIGTAAGMRSPKGGGTGGTAFTGSSVGRRTPVASGSGLLTLTTVAVGARQPVAVGASALMWVGVAAGVAGASAVLDLTVRDVLPPLTVTDVRPPLTVASVRPPLSVADTLPALTVRNAP